jgi:hypothetical protein
MKSPKSLTLDFDTAVEELRAVIAEKGEDYVYEPDGTAACSYFDGTEPGCIIGHVLVRHGFTYEDVVGSERLFSNGADVATLVAKDIIQVDNDHTEYLLSYVQSYQDGGQAWSDALTSALKEMQQYISDEVDEGDNP